MKNRYFKALTIGLALCSASTAFAQKTNTIKGTVVDENGNPVIGATVRVSGAKTGTVTDLEGNYSIQAPIGSSLTVNYIGYKQVSTKGGRVAMTANDTDLGEVVVVGYGTQRKAHLTGSVATVPTEDIQDLSSGGLASTLTGLVNGLSVSGGEARPGENARLYIRDTNSLSDIGSTAQQPLFVIDGYIYPNDIKIGNSTQNLGAEAFNNLDPSEVESISVLKDASAAVYGARAANGVILVTTKKGKMGAPRISYGGTFGFTDEVARPKMLSAYEYGRLYNAVAAADPTSTTLNHQTALFQADELEAMKSLNYDLLDKYWETGFTQKHNVNVSGATDRVSYFGGLSYFDQDGNLGRLDYNRWNFRAGIDAKISKWLGAGLTVSGDYGKKNTPLVKVGGTNKEKDYALLLTRPRYLPETVGDYDLLALGASNTEKSQNQLYAYNVLQNDGDYKRNMNSNLNINANVSYDFGWSKLLKGLKLRFSYNKSINTDKGNEYGSAYTLYNMTNRFGSGNHLYTPIGNETDLGSYYAEKVLGVERPRVGLLNIGAEESKGDELRRETYRKLKEAGAAGHLNFVGNVEAKEAMMGACDVIVSDGYSGNIMLKSIEGTGKLMAKELKAVLMKSAGTKLAALLLKSALTGFKKMLDPNEVGGTALLGISRPVVKAHGSSNEVAFCNAIRQAAEVAQSGIIADIEANIDKMRISRED